MSKRVYLQQTTKSIERLMKLNQISLIQTHCPVCRREAKTDELTDRETKLNRVNVISSYYKHDLGTIRQVFYTIQSQYTPEYIWNSPYFATQESEKLT